MLIAWAKGIYTLCDGQPALPARDQPYWYSYISAELTSGYSCCVEQSQQVVRCLAASPIHSDGVCGSTPCWARLPPASYGPNTLVTGGEFDLYMRRIISRHKLVNEPQNARVIEFLLVDQETERRVGILSGAQTTDKHTPREQSGKEVGRNPQIEL